LRLFFCRVGQENAAGALLSLFHVLDDHTIAQWLQIHERIPPDIKGWQCWHETASTD